MGFSSFLCSKSSHSIPAYPYAELPVELSHIVAIFPDNSIKEGYYNGYYAIHDKPDFEAYCNAVTSKRYHADNEKSFKLHYKEAFKVVLKSKYNGEKYDELSPLIECPEQGYFYSDKTIHNLLTGN